MLTGIVHITGEQLSRREVREISEGLVSHRTQLLSLRGCRTKNSNFSLLMRSLSESKSIVQLNLNIGVVRTLTHVHSLSHVLTQNRSLTSLFLHGCSLGYEGVTLLVQGLSLHPNVVSLDLGDCHLTDSALMAVSDLLPPNGAKRGLQDLILSANQGITPHGWSKFFVAMAAGSQLRSLHVDYNNVMDYGAGCLAVALAASKTLINIDLESCGLTELGGQSILHLVRSFPISCQQIILKDNDITSSTLSAIRDAFNSSDADDTTDTSGTSSSEDSPSDHSVKFQRHQAPTSVASCSVNFKSDFASIGLSEISDSELSSESQEFDSEIFEPDFQERQKTIPLESGLEKL